MAPAPRPSWYTSHYCEENAYRLAHDPALGATDIHVVFVSNAQRCVPVWRQQLSPAPDEPVLWDYHVVVVGRRGGWLTWDLDTTLPFPSPAAAWLLSSFPSTHPVKPEYQPRFRVVPRDVLARTFSSDRSHMKREDGSWAMPPPALPLIQAPGVTMNLFSFVDMGDGGEGEVLTLDQALHRWS